MATSMEGERAEGEARQTRRERCGRRSKWAKREGVWVTSRGQMVLFLPRLRGP